VSNALGTINPVARSSSWRTRAACRCWSTARRRAAHAGRRAGARLRLLRVLGHKLYGPTGIGVLYGKAALLEAMPPYRAAAT
jgi:cysteine desulfurase/selenocysteine lyase